MAEILAVGEVAATGWKLLKPFAGFIAAAAVGFGAAETYEHRIPWGLSAQVARAKHDLTAARVDTKAAQVSLAQCQANRVTLSDELDAQNAAVAALKARGDQLTAQATKAAQQAATARQSASKSATAILNTKAGADHCASALSILKGDAG